MITKKDILQAIGAETDDHFMTGMLIGIGVGAIVGSAVAILLAPRAGSEMRQMVSERGSELIEKAKTRVGLSKNGGGPSSEASGTLGGSSSETGGSGREPIR